MRNLITSQIHTNNIKSDSSLVKIFERCYTQYTEYASVKMAICCRKCLEIHSPLAL